MPKAGMFAGEVTTAAPADGATTSKGKGFQWMEYGNIDVPYVPESYTMNSSSGWAVTQRDWWGTGNQFDHPFRDINTAGPMTFTAVFSPQDLGLPGQGFTLVDFGSWSNSGGLGCSRRPISEQMYFGMSLPSYGTPYRSVEATAEVSINKPTWDETDWYFMGLSYEKDVRRSAVIMNLTKNDGFQIHPPKLYLQTPQLNVVFPTTTEIDTINSGSLSVMAWGCGSNTGITGNLTTPFQGFASQIVIHNKYLDFHDYNNGTSKICKQNGVIDLGVGAANVWGEQVLYYAPGGVPLGNEGTLNVGDESDYWLNGTFVPAANKPPVAP